MKIGYLSSFAVGVVGFGVTLASVLMVSQALDDEDEGCGTPPAGGHVFPCEDTECVRRRVQWIECARLGALDRNAPDGWAVTTDELISRAALGGEQLKRAVAMCRQNNFSECQESKLQRIGKAAVMVGSQK